MRATELSYMAGLFDGEGCIMSDTNERNRFRLLRVELNNCDRALIDWIAERFPARIYVRSAKGNRREWYGLQWYNEQGYELLLILLPYLVCKRERAEIAIQSWEAADHESKMDGMRRISELNAQASGKSAHLRAALRSAQRATG